MNRSACTDAVLSLSSSQTCWKYWHTTDPAFWSDAMEVQHSTDVETVLVQYPEITYVYGDLEARR